MNIGMMTTWGQHCGVFGYTEQLVTALMGKGNWVTVFGNTSYGKRIDGCRADLECFGTGFQSKDGQGLDLDKVKSLILERFPIAAFEVFHIQYQDYLYPDKSNFDKLLSFLKGKRVKLVVTQHDSCISPNLDWGKFDIIIRHGSDFKKEGKNVTMPIGIPEIEYKPLPRNKVLSSFGMGRNDNETCQKVCDKLGWTFRFHNSQDKWIPIKDLMKWLQEGDAIALIYPPVGAEVSSSALRVALGTGRPVIVSHTNWFKDMEWDTPWVEWDAREWGLDNYLERIQREIDVWDVEQKESLKKIQEKYGWKTIVKYYEEIYAR